MIANKLMKYSFDTPITLTLVAAMLCGCAAPNLQKRSDTVSSVVQAGTNLGSVGLPLGGRVIGSAAMIDELARKQAAPAVSGRASRPWYGSKMVVVQSDEELPPIFSERLTLEYDDRANAGRVSLEVLAERIYRATRVPIRISADVNFGPSVMAAASQVGQSQTFLPIPGSSVGRSSQGLAPSFLTPLSPAGVGVPTPVQSSDPAKTVLPISTLQSLEVVWKDQDMTTILNAVTDRLGLGWSYKDGVVTIYRFTTESFELSAFLSSQDFRMNISGTSGGSAGTGGASGGSSAQLQVNESGKTDAVESFVKMINAMILSTPGSSAVLSDGTARLTVTTTKDTMRRVRGIVKQELASLSRQVMIQIDIYSLLDTSGAESGVNLAALFANLSKTFNFSVAGPTSLVSAQSGSVATNILSAASGGNASSKLVSQLGNSSLVLQALAQTGYSVQHQPLNMIAINRQWARKTNLRQTGYLSETTPSTVAGAGSGAPGLKTSTITTGDRFVIQPAILDNGSVLLKFGVSLTTLLGLFDVSAGAGATLQKVQTPEVSGTDDQSTVILRAGEVMALTGLSRTKSTNDGRSLGEGVSKLLGGSQKLSTSREDFVIFIRPVIL